MPEPLKNVYNQPFFDSFAQAANTAWPGFAKKEFLAAVYTRDWEAKELKDRMRHLALVLNGQLAGDFRARVNSILHLIEALEKRGVKGGFEYMFLPDYVAQFGLNDWEVSLQAMERITRFASCEFAIRPFLLAHQQEVMAQMLRWSKHPHPHVRRFSSEGCRPRLPWAMAIPALKKDPSPLLPLLENLKADDSLFVRKSVANNLNDIAKDHPDVAAALAKKWKGFTAETDWIIRHGCRTLLKKAHPATYALFQLAPVPDCTVTGLALSQKALLIGDRLRFSFALKTGKEPARLRLEYAIYYVKANGQQSRKLFQLKEGDFAPGKTFRFKKEQRFQDFTTRKHYPGEHRLAIVVNGQEVIQTEFLLCQ